ncbi:MAG: hypothetical protein R3C14_38705 [Caldilineaceae bacterium]
MLDVDELASRILLIEHQIAAYEKLHADELAELRQLLGACKREIAILLRTAPVDSVAADRASSTVQVVACDDTVNSR